MNRISYVIVGATGDLAKTKIYTSIFDLYTRHILNQSIDIWGIARSSQTDNDYRQCINSSIISDKQVPQDFLDIFRYYQSDFSDSQTLIHFIEYSEFNLEDTLVLYLAIPPQAVSQVLQAVRALKQMYPAIRLRLVLEKPFGSDLSSAQALNDELGQFCTEEEIYRLDHYLGKETVQNILALRFGNTMFEPLLNNHYVESIQIDVLEARGIDQRAEYFDSSGIIKDIFQNHILQVLALLMMEPPVRMEAEFIRDEKYKIFKSLRSLDCPEVIMGQYISNGEMKGYREEKGVATDSQTETFMALTTFVDNPRWQDVPIYVTTGKRLAESKAEIRIRFKPTFRYFMSDDEGCNPQANELVIQIQPDEQVYYSVNAKFPGKGMCIQPVKLHFTYQESFNVTSPGAYARLIQDMIEGDQTLFVRADEIEAAWEYIMPLIDSIERKENDLVLYPAGSTIEELQKLQG